MLNYKLKSPMNKYKLSLVLVTFFSITTFVLFALGYTGNLPQMSDQPTTNLWVFIFLANFFSLAFSTLFFILQKAKKDNKSRERLELLEKFAKLNDDED